MKKSLKALILCGLASLVMFAVIYASPITAQAQTVTHSGDITLENTTNVIGTATVTFDDAEVGSTGPVVGVAGIIYGTADQVGLEVYFAAGTSTVNAVPVSYNFVFNGTTYSGTGTLTYLSTQAFFWNVFEMNTSGPDSSGYQNAIKELTNNIDKISNDPTLTGDDRVIEFNSGTALNGDVMRVLAGSKDVTVKFTFVYAGYEFCTTITSEDAKRIYSADIPWYGPCYLAINCPTVWTGKIA